MSYNMFVDCLLWLLLLQLMAVGALGQDWSVKYTQLETCALKGATVMMYSTYKHPSHLRDVKTFWIKNPVRGMEPTDLHEDPDYSGRIEYFEEKNQKESFILKLKNVTEKDEHMYCLRITSNIQKERTVGYPGVTLRVTDLRVDVPERVEEGNTTLLMCRTSCSLTHRDEIIWYKNGHPVETNKEGKNTLSLQPTRAEDSGSYSCAVKGLEHLPSPAVTLRVRYLSVNVSVSISPSGEIMEGSSVTLTCSGDANPPVEDYAWFKEKQLVGKGQTHTIPNISSKDAGLYKCKARNAEDHKYSSGVTLSVVHGQSKVYQAVIGFVVFCTLLSSVIFAVYLRRKKKFCWSEDRVSKEDNVYNTAVEMPSNNRTIGPVDQYASIALQRAEGSAVKTSTCEEVQHRRDKVVEKPQEEDVQYASVVFNHSYRSAAMMEDPSVIYSTLK